MVVVAFKMTENVSQMLNQSERQTEDRHYRHGLQQEF